MSAGLWIFILFIGGLLLVLSLRAAIQRGGRKVKPVNPRELIFFPEDGDGKEYQNPTFTKRFIPLEGTHNFRDLGGYHTREGRTVRWGRIFRSDEFSELSDTGLEKLKALKLRLVIDLRSPREMKGKENRLPAGCTYRHLRIYKREPILEYLPLALFQRHALSRAMGGSYLKLAETRAKTFGAALRFLADERNFPIVYHCSAGKDRTGIVAALVLALLGVPEETIIADYSLSNLGFEHFYTEFIQSGRLDHWGIPYAEFQGLFIVQPIWMRNLLAHLRTKYGSVEDYLFHKAGLEAGELESIRDNLLE